MMFLYKDCKEYKKTTFFYQNYPGLYYTTQYNRLKW